MPYIPDKDRPRLDPLIDQLTAELKKLAAEYNANAQGTNPTAYGGPFNYGISRILGQFALESLRYSNMTLEVGVLLTAIFEFYRRVIAPYEDQQIKKNGDIPEYAILAEKIRTMK